MLHLNTMRHMICYELPLHNQRPRALLEKRKDAILDALADPYLSRGERKLLEAQHKEIKSDIRTIKYGAPLRVLRALERKWR